MEEEEVEENYVEKSRKQQRRRVSDETNSPERWPVRASDLKGGDLHFTQQAPEMSQHPLPPKAIELTRLTQLNDDVQERIVTDLARMLLFKGLSGEPIDRLKVIKEAIGDQFDSQRTNIANAALAKASERLRQTFGFELSRAPKYMEDDKYFPCSKTKIKDRLYLINSVKDDETGSHSKALQSVHIESSVEKGLLMLILAFIYCKGEMIKEGKTRWITCEALYRLLHSVDEHIPAEPPSSSSSRAASSSWEANTDTLISAQSTPNVDALLQKFVYFDYLIKMKMDENAQGTQTQSNNDDSNHVAYAMGPRAALEIGRKQVLFFCSEILDEQPDPTMLAELDEQDDHGNDEE